MSKRTVAPSGKWQAVVLRLFDTIFLPTDDVFLLPVCAPIGRSIAKAEGVGVDANCGIAGGGGFLHEEVVVSGGDMVMAAETVY